MPSHETAPDGAQPSTASTDESKLTLNKETLAELDVPPGDGEAIRGGTLIATGACLLYTGGCQRVPPPGTLACGTTLYTCIR